MCNGIPRRQARDRYVLEMATCGALLKSASSLANACDFECATYTLEYDRPAIAVNNVCAFNTQYTGVLSHGDYLRLDIQDMTRL